MSESATTMVWYVAYGSNLAEQRLQCYLDGTSPAGAGRSMRGARDATPPRRSAPCRLRGRLRFSRRSRVWGGGIAFYDPDGTDEVWARRYLVSWAQFEDIYAQENGRPTAPLARDAIGAAPDGDAGWYRRTLALDSWQGHPSVTFTEPEPATPAPPTANYLSWMMGGLADGHGTSVAIADYLLNAAGVAPHWSRDELVALSRSPLDRGLPAPRSLKTASIEPTKTT